MQVCMSVIELCMQVLHEQNFHCTNC